MSTRVKVNKKHQIVIASGVRRQLRIASGDYLDVVVKGRTIVLTHEPANWTEYLLGLHKDSWEGIDTDEYLREERNSWER
jgi:AbrB family looped-hinge helix DNA binding protein